MNLRPLGPQPSALPSYAIPREQKLLYQKPEKKQPENIVRNIQKRKRTRRFRRSFQFFIKKNGPWHILAPRAVACDNLHLRASAHHWHVSAFCVIGNSSEFPITQNRFHPARSVTVWTSRFFLQHSIHRADHKHCGHHKIWIRFLPRTLCRDLFIRIWRRFMKKRYNSPQVEIGRASCRERV